MTTICWKGLHSEDWAAWATFHREIAAKDRKDGNAVSALAQEEIAAKYDRRAARAEKNLAKSPQLWPVRAEYHWAAARSHLASGDTAAAKRHEEAGGRVRTALRERRALEGGGVVKLAKVWIVRNPTFRSTLADICWEQEVARLDRYILGSPTNAWTEENHVIYTNQKDAEADARDRFAQMARPR